ncbi:MAG: DUF2497 domain-containing protein [Alphaproteobacteria bacterium]|nr:DUF2497 domain-containing protein [Alphaproteobacteria bacterium]
MEQEEPTMEEILASIRQILSGEENAPSSEKTEEPIVLDPPVKKEPILVPPPPVFEPKEKEIPPVVAEPAPNAETQHITFTAPTTDNIITLTPEMLVVPEEVFEEKEEVILSEPDIPEDAVEQVPTPAVAETVKQEEPKISEAPLSDSGNDALTNLMAELLKPALRDWMNKNMTQVLEKLVQEELKNKNLS